MLTLTPYISHMWMNLITNLNCQRIIITNDYEAPKIFMYLTSPRKTDLQVSISVHDNETILL
jgi:hypothetical protein